MLIPHDHPALTPDSRGICWLAFIPAETQDHIASFLEYKNNDNETREHFEKRLKNLCSAAYKGERTARVIDLRAHKFYIAQNGTVKKTWGIVKRSFGGPMTLSMTGLAYSNEETVPVYEIPEKQQMVMQFISGLITEETPPEQVTQIGISANNRYLISLTRDRSHYEKIVGLYVTNLLTKKSTKIPLPTEMQPEKITVNSMEELLLHINKGYSYISWGNPDNPQYTLSNPITFVAVSCNGKKIALANNRAVYVMKLQNNAWQTELLNEEVFVKVDEQLVDGNWPEFWHWPTKTIVDFNYEGTLLGFGCNHKYKVADTVIIKEISKEPYRCLWHYFRSKFICANLPASTLVILK